jgi:putative peptidoglycan lipid II flippase
MTDRDAREKGIAGAASIVGFATVVSRVLGYTRDAVVAYVFGAGMSADAFFMAFRISNLLRRLVGEGALTSSFIPIFTEEMGRRDSAGLMGLVSGSFTVFGLIFVVLSGLGMAFSREIVWFMAPGFSSDPEKFGLTVNLTRFMFPYMAFVGLTAIAMGVLNSLRHFTAPAFAPVFFNVAIIPCVLILAPVLPVPAYSLAVGVLLGGLLQFGVLLPYLKRFGYLPAPALDLAVVRDRAIKKIFVLMGPAAFGVGVYQLNIFVTMWFSSRLPEGSVSYLYYSGRLMELPLGVFGVAIATAALPSLSERAARGDWAGFKDSVSFALRIANFVTIPATIGLFVLSYPIIELLFKRGEFNANDARGTADALYYYSLGIVPVSISRILTSVYYSVKDTATPVWVAAVSFVFNVGFCFALAPRLGHGGLALATTLSAGINATALLIVLRKRFGRFGGRAILSSALKSALASLVMGALIRLISSNAWYEGAGMPYRVVMLVGCLLAGMVTFITISIALRTPEMTFLKGILRIGRR